MNQLNSPSPAHQSTLSPINQNILMTNSTTNPNVMSSPVKMEPMAATGHYTQQHHQQANVIPPASPKTTAAISKTVVKTEDYHHHQQQQQQLKQKMQAQAASSAVDNEFENDEVTDLIGIDLAAEKKTLLAATTSSKATNLDQIRACKDEKFLNIMILHKKFMDIGKKQHK